MVAVTVSACGQIGWIGLVIPHMARTWVGPDHRIMLPVTALMGGIFLLGADLAARSLTSAELPVSILTALIGGPIFAFLLYRNRAKGWM
jgi:iron complex transport system permease protein